ncbi:MAG TPA: SRPBCC family protein [Pseudogracilibacillus sp.]|nr:SRPBCC family protein [Pseudogracilibacillus sp.]
MIIHPFQQRQSLPISLDEAWEFFSNPQNLPKLTPDWMHLTFKENIPNNMSVGMKMTQQVKPLFGIPLTWVTEITQIEEKVYFVDEQRIGPYRFWHHEHRLHERPSGVEVIDSLHYALPFNLLGEIAHQLSVKKKVAEVFEYRYETLENLFGK